MDSCTPHDVEKTYLRTLDSQIQEHGSHSFSEQQLQSMRQALSALAHGSLDGLASMLVEHIQSETLQPMIAIVALGAAKGDNIVTIDASDPANLVLNVSCKPRTGETLPYVEVTANREPPRVGGHTAQGFRAGDYLYQKDGPSDTDPDAAQIAVQLSLRACSVIVVDFDREPETTSQSSNSQDATVNQAADETAPQIPEPLNEEIVGATQSSASEFANEPVNEPIEINPPEETASSTQSVAPPADTSSGAWSANFDYVYPHERKEESVKEITSTASNTTKRKPLKIDQLASAWKEALIVRDFSEINKDLEVAIRAVFRLQGAEAVDMLRVLVNDATFVFRKGPDFGVDEQGRVTIRHVSQEGELQFTKLPDGRTIATPMRNESDIELGEQHSFLVNT